MPVLVQQTAFNRGELDPALSGRSDWQPYFSGARTLRNMVCRPGGGAVKRGGTEFVASALSDSAPSRFVRFQFSADQSYLLEFGERRFRVIRDGGLVVYPSGHADAGKAVVLDSPYTAAQAAGVKTAQKEDVMVFTHPGLQPRILTRVDHHDWRFSPFETGASIRPPAGLALTLDGRNGARYVVSAISDSNEESVASDMAECGTAGEPVGIPDYDNLTAAHCRSLWESYGFEWPEEWRWELPSRWNHYTTILAHVLVPMFGYANAGYGDWWQNFARPDGTSDGIYCESSMNSLNNFRNEAEMAINSTWLTAAANVPLLADMRGRIREYVEERNAGAVVTAHSALRWSAVPGAARYRVYRSHRTADGARYYPLGETTGLVFDDDNLPAVSAETPQAAGDPFSGPDDYPAVCAFYQQRLIMACTNNKPNTVWGSRVGAFRNFNRNEAPEGGVTLVGDASAFEHAIDSGQANGILWAVALNKILFGTAGGEVVMHGPGGLLSATSVNATQQSNYGCYHVTQEVIGQSIVGGAAGGHGMRAYRWEYTGDAFGGKSVSIYSGHLFNNRRVAGWAYQHEPESVLWVAMSDGALLSLTYMDEEEVLGWARHDTDGRFEAVANISSNNVRSEIYFQVARTVGGVTRRYIERLKAPQDSGDDVRDAWYVDSGLGYRGAPKSEFSGLAHLEGKDVVCLGDGHVITGLTVNGGAVALPFAVSRAVIGLPFTAELETMEMEPSGGESLAPASKTPVAASVLFYHTRECLYGHAGREKEIDFRDRLDEPHPEPIRPKTIRKNFLVPSPVGDDRAVLRMTSPSPVPFGALSAALCVEAGGINPGPGKGRRWADA